VLREEARARRFEEDWDFLVILINYNHDVDRFRELAFFEGVGTRILCHWGFHRKLSRIFFFVQARKLGIRMVNVCLSRDCSDMPATTKI